ncbi:bifunctional DNA-formamidopyrimidine glycosylase/DNA-(apurinic or apyrimidinic site) lyase [Enterobacteriaceae endosymbiont of Neohaemonia nigricornis]|uniref:bifunctional DNA-formamidopyrimidine glycosylase/DNA-(apurinic or apyrimidinic site) lyase n=1 Tax=Enterobacteriaceae endosymbiont of Neohaemonia nigricornis TaxID=2675792 RepID=UPI001449F64A|nr:bifunctional DNA-formamidopyrimidine glycosylase/DNA-(apurinic or apyrimidinic site) lyase [Enterobacteriaceae endosymbiont of Neohaemonia nigricornis]QJC30596.1 bifunctional DNA-formamidopyrimidine glycosylase/DNA-(apurinic or apyrimidinic site) lyase [Enterobacteriaceae endosymbiont of Neohaemonia nigricornis]
MPELPEVEVIKTIIKNKIKNNIINYAIIRTNKLRYNIPSEIFTLYNQKIINVKRRGRYLILILLNNAIIIHLGMSGSLTIIKKNILPTKHDYIDLIINNKFVLRYNDPRKFGFWLWESLQYKTNIFLSKLGLEPLHVEFNNLYMYNIIQTKKIPIKVLLMENNIITGVGNIYANESLFLSKILPFRVAKDLSFIEITNLVKNIKYILTQSIIYGGTTINNYKQPNNILGNFTQYLHVYNKANQPCYICNTMIIKIYQRNRSSFYCPNCQK